jgi:hypothetical protein
MVDVIPPRHRALISRTNGPPEEVATASQNSVWNRSGKTGIPRWRGRHGQTACSDHRQRPDVEAPVPCSIEEFPLLPGPPAAQRGWSHTTARRVAPSHSASGKFAGRTGLRS